MAKERNRLRVARHVRIRKGLRGTPERPRLVVHRSLKHISAQIIDDTTGQTLAAASTIEKTLEAKGTKDGAKTVGTKLAERAKEKGITAIVFDRGGFKYHGQVASLADGAREAGLEF